MPPSFEPLSLRSLLLALAVASFGCSSTTHPNGGAGGETPGTGGATTGAGTGGTADAGALDASDDAGGGPATFNVFDAIPQFGIYDTTEPSYTPPTGVLMWSYGTVFVTQLSAEQQASIGSDLAARVTFLAECDNYDRLGGLFFLTEPKGQMPQPTDARTEIVRFITPFSDYTAGPLATHVYPDADISPYAQALVDPSHDVWVGIAGGSNPYSGDPCSSASVPANDKAVGFKYSVDFVSTKPLIPATSVVLTAVADVSETSTPVAGTFTNPGGPLTGHVTVIVTGHGSGTGGDEYENTADTVTVNGTQVGSFSTAVDCAAYAQYSPDGNPGIFQDNTGGNPRNWCPGALVASHTFPVTLTAGSNTVSLGITPGAVPSGSYYATSINFTSP
jgi:Peptide-N-glycosidase F, C terminal/Peptide-N-glycosidase F, N terminal